MRKKLETFLVEEKAHAYCNMLKKNLADLIKNKRNKKGITIRGLYGLSGVSTTVISDLENQEYLPRIEVIMRLLYALNIPFEKVLPPDIHNYNRKDSEYNLDFYLSSLGLKNDAIKEVKDFINFKECQAKGRLKKEKLQ